MVPEDRKGDLKKAALQQLCQDVHIDLLRLRRPAAADPLRLLFTGDVDGQVDHGLGALLYLAADRVASVPVAMELAAVLMCHDAFVERGDEREQAAERLSAAAERFGRNAGWFEKCYSVSSFIEYATRMFAIFSGRYRGF